jgi:uncharacterized protein YlxP (DUF503 family)
MYVGIMHVLMIVPEARTRKDKRQAIRSLTDKIKHRFNVSCHLLGHGDHPGRQRIILTTAGGDMASVKQAFETVRAFLQSYDRAWPGSVDSEIFSWHTGSGPMESLNG